MRESKFVSWILFFFTFLMLDLSATLVGNPAQPAILKSGIIHTSPNWWSFRLGYYGDFVYNQRLHDEFKIAGCTHTPTYIRMWTQASTLTLNFRDWIDLYGIFGGSRMEIDKDINMSQQICWGFGGKLIILHEGKFRAAVDIKYFQTNQTPQYFLCEGTAYNVVSDFHFHYHEIQAAMGLSYRMKFFSPYANATYLIAKVEPEPLIAVVRLPVYKIDVDVVSKSVIGSRRWGLALGATLIDNRKMTLGVEWRGFNQNSVDVNGEIRF